MVHLFQPLKQGLVVSNRPLLREELFQVSIDKLNPEWTSSLMLGVLAHPPDKLHLPVRITIMLPVRMM